MRRLNSIKFVFRRFTRFILILFAFLSIPSCTHKQFVKNAAKIMGQQITLPTDMNTTWQGRDTVLTGYLEAPIKLIAWYDSLGCASCRVGKMSDWDNIVAYADSLSQWFSVIFLFTPKEEHLQRMKLALQTDKFDYPVFIDRHATFIKQNPNIPKHPQLHSFLLDKNNKVVIVGSPLYNPGLWGLYKRTIQKMIENDGVLPEQ